MDFMLFANVIECQKQQFAEAYLKFVRQENNVLYVQFTMQNINIDRMSYFLKLSENLRGRK